jgi:1,2-diacylglycerol 3-beta-glucosyltransferase
MVKKIGIVEDEGIVALDISNILTDLGYEVAFIADNGENALVNIDETRPDAVLMDIELKGVMNGLQTAVKIKDKHSIPIIFLTAFEDDSTVARIKNVSGDGYLVKPFEDGLLKTALEEVLS